MRLYLPTILRESLTPRVIAKFRNFAFSKPGTNYFNAFKAFTVPFLPCIYALVRSSLFKVL